MDVNPTYLLFSSYVDAVLAHDTLKSHH